MKRAEACTMNFVIIPVVVGKEMTRLAIDSALAQDVGNVCVYVIGNGSRDGTVPYVRSRYWGQRNVIITSCSMMQSLNRVWNGALEFVFHHHADHVLVINNDVVLRPDTYRLLLADGGQFVTGVSVGDMKMIEQADPTSKSPHPCFSCFLIRRECWKRVGPFDEDFWSYCSDADMHLRMDAAGIDAYALAVPFYHETSSTIKLVSNETRDWLQRCADQDREYFKQKWGCAVGSQEYYAKFRSARDNRYAKEGVL